jgi:hypothetical protein
MPSYGNYIKAVNQAFPYLSAFVCYLLWINRRNGHPVTFFMDSTALSVCNNHYISSHKVCKGLASRGKTTKGWFYGFKLHGFCDGKGNLLHIKFTTGSVHDSQVAESLAEAADGLYVGDAGYLLQKEVFERLFEKHKHIMAATRKNMKRLASKGQIGLLRKRNIIETTWDVLKERFQLVYHLARSVTGLFRHYMLSLISFLLRPLAESDVPSLLPLLAIK